MDAGEQFPFPLPNRVRVISLHEPYASLVIEGRKTIETRTWPWPYDPSWLVIHASKKVDREACDRLGIGLRAYAHGLIGLVWVAGPSRPLLPEDETAACFYEPGRHAWPLEHPRPFVKPIPFRGPQKFTGITRGVVEIGLRGAP